MRPGNDGGAASAPEEREAATIRFNRERYGRVIRTHRTALGMTQAELADAVHVPKNNVTHWEAGRTRPDLNTVPLVCEALRIDLATFFGVQEHYESLSTADRALLGSIHALPEHDRRVIQATVDSMHEIARQDRWAFCRTQYVPIMRNEQSAAAGTGEALQAAGQQSVFIRKNRLSQRADELVRVNGESMEPDFHHGQDVYVQHTGEVTVGEIGLFIVNGEGFIKQLGPNRLHSLNPAYPDIALNEEDDVRCVGRVLGPVEAADYPSPEDLRILEELAASGEMNQA